ncbi:MAG: DsrE/DsrF/DrsH-like family protein [Gammaproteobacteria bacterium]|nr:DsrE/DsrF/DrsH-like family protein [Gammaproteobacteria bacterium]
MAQRLFLIVTSGAREKLQMAGMIAAVAAATGTETSVFLSMNALTYFVKGGLANAPAEGPMGRLMEEKNVPPFVDLFRQAVALGAARLYPCSMAVDVMHLMPEDLDPVLEKPLGLTRFLTEMEGSQVLTF